MTDEELFVLLAMEVGEPQVIPKIIRGDKGKMVIPSVGLQWLQQFVEVCTVAGKTFQHDWELGEFRERYRYWYQENKHGLHPRL